jgi:two-component system, OmpR family, response regulator
MRLLIIDGDPITSSKLRRVLEEHGFVVDLARCGEQGSYLARVNAYDLILTDYRLPNKPGKQVCVDIRSAGLTVPIIGVIGSNDLESRLDLFMAGADDCLSKDDSARELLARIRAVLRRAPDIQPETIEVSGLSLNARTQRVRFQKKPINLSTKEFGILEFLLRNRGSVVSKSDLVEKIWNGRADPMSNTVQTHIFNIRKKLGRSGKDKIRNVQGRGYIID